MDTVKVIPIEPVNRDDRGYVAEYTHERSGQHLVIFSHAGAVRGRHYHKGASPTKNPEVVVLISGRCILNWKVVGTSEITMVEVQAPAKIEVYPNVWHELIAETDFAMVELNSIPEHAGDTYYDG